MHFDIVVIGKGMMGAAAARYLSQYGVRVAVIGPDETADGRHAMVYASHYDQARVQRLIGRDAVWTRLNVLSVQAYAALQAETGISFHATPGCIYVNPYGEDDYLRLAATHADAFNINYQHILNNAALSATFPQFHFPGTSMGLFETSPSGFINPRLLIKAQLRSYAQKDGQIIPQVVTGVATTQHNGYAVTLDDATVVYAQQVLLAPGAFANYFSLTEQRFAITTKSEVVLLAQVTAATAAALQSLPSLLYEIDEAGTEGVYLIQPVLYPDGNYYLKMGCNMPGDMFFSRLEEVQDWFRHGNSDQCMPVLVKALHTIMPALQTTGYATKRCVITRTATKRPYIAALDGRGLYVATGGNGYAAMCSDAIGKTAATLVMEKTLPDGFTAEDFAPVFV